MKEYVCIANFSGQFFSHKVGDKFTNPDPKIISSFLEHGLIKEVKIETTNKKK